uniref:EF-hand domain-containing protein n=1 Tax=Anopheles atroparvus TaxID=41427 RepID=A0AAG5D9F5_ANOAO
RTLAGCVHCAEREFVCPSCQSAQHQADGEYLAASLVGRKTLETPRGPRWSPTVTIGSSRLSDAPHNENKITNILTDPRREAPAPSTDRLRLEERQTAIHRAVVIHGLSRVSRVMWPGFDKGSGKLDAASNSQQETLADIEHISTIAGSLGSIGTISQSGDGEPVYETDHTDLNSEYDEVELRRELMKDKWRQLFDAFDPEGFGEIPVDDF